MTANIPVWLAWWVALVAVPVIFLQVAVGAALVMTILDWLGRHLRR